MALPKVNNPTYELVIPSTQEKVEFRPYLVKEEKVLMIAMESNDEKQIVRATKNIVSECLFGKVNVDTLTTFDIEYIFAKLRIKSVGETSEMSMKCKSCDQFTPVAVNLEKAIRIEGKTKKENRIKLTDNISVTMKYPTINEVLQNFEGTQASQIDKIFAVIISCIDTIEQGDTIYEASESTNEELKEFIESLNSAQFKAVQGFVENMPQVVADVKYKCASCGHDNEITVQGLSNFFE